MQYLGTKNGPAPLIRNVVLEDPEKEYGVLVGYMRLAYQKAEIVHGDLSEYNILWYRRKPYIIDVGQAVLIDHPNSKDMLLRDIENLNRYFRNLGVDIMNTEDVMETVTGAKK